MNDLKPLLLFALLALGLIVTWVYHLYDKTIYSNKTKEIIVRDSAAIADAVNDSLKKFYQSTVKKLDERFDSSQAGLQDLHEQIALKLREINDLKKEILSVLTKKKVSGENIFLTGRKIKTLQIKIDELKGKNDSLKIVQSQITDSLTTLTEAVRSLERKMNRMDSAGKSLRGW
jgi:chromosome segregation ATPase